MMQTRKYANHYVQSLLEAQQRMGHMDDRPTRDRSNGFIEIPLSEEEPREKRDQAEKEICPFSEAQLRDIGAMTAEVKEVRPDSCFIELAYQIGQRRRVATAFCTYAASLTAGDELVILVREVGAQQVINILGLKTRERRVTNV